MKGMTMARWFVALFAALAFGFAQAAHEGHSHGEPAPVLRVLALFPMTGPGASLGAYLEQGAMLAKEEIEKQHGGQLEVDLQILDSKGKAAEAVGALQTALARQKPHAIITSLSPVSRAIKPVVEKEGILTLVTMTTMQDIARDTKHMVRVYANAGDFAAPVAAHAKKHFGKVHVLYMQDEFGQSMYEAYAAALKGSAVTVTSGTYEMMQKDTRPLVARAVEEKPDAVYVIGYGPAYIATFRYLRELAPGMPVLADSTFSDPANLAALGNAADGTVFSGTENELTQGTLPSANAFKAAFLARYNRPAYGPAIFTYDALTLIRDVSWKKGKVSAPAKKDVLKRSPVKGVLGPIRIDREGESSFSTQLMKVENGRIVAIP